MRRGAVITQYFALLTKVIRSSSRNILKKRKISIVSTHYIYDGPGRGGFCKKSEQALQCQYSRAIKKLQGMMSQEISLTRA